MLISCWYHTGVGADFAMVVGVSRLVLSVVEQRAVPAGMDDDSTGELLGEEALVEMAAAKVP